MPNKAVINKTRFLMSDFLIMEYDKKVAIEDEKILKTFK